MFTGNREILYGFKVVIKRIFTGRYFMKKRAIFSAVVIIISTTLFSCSSIPKEVIEKKYTNSESKFLEVDGLRVHYRIEGKGPVLVLLHGMLSSLHTWDGWTERLKKNYTVVRLDMPGFGLTGPGPDRFLYTRQEFEKVLDDIFNGLKLKKFTLAGNSLGGFFSWRYAIRHPEKVEKLILIDSVAYDQDVPLPITLMTMPVVGTMSTVITPKFIIDHFSSQVYGDKSKVTDELKDRYYELLMREGNRDSSKKILGEMKIQAENPQISDGLASLNNKLPILVLWGRLDPWVPVTCLERWKKDLPDAEYVIFENEGHTPMEENPDMTADAAIAFLNQNGKTE